MAQTVLPLNPLTAWDSRLARPGLHTTVQHKAMLSPQNLRRALCQARSTIRRRVDSAPAYPCTTNAGRNGRKGSPQSYERCQPPYTSTDGSEDPPLFSLESRTVSFSAEKEMVLAPAAGAANPFRRDAGPLAPWGGNPPQGNRTRTLLPAAVPSMETTSAAPPVAAVT